MLIMIMITITITIMIIITTVIYLNTRSCYPFPRARGSWSSTTN